MRIRIIRPAGKYKAGEVLDIGREKAHKLIKAGKAIVSKEMLDRDYKTK